MQKPINFSYNWNNKLNNEIFTTIRKHSLRFKEGEIYPVALNNRIINRKTLKQIHTTKFGEIPKLIVMLDTGYSYTESQNLFMKFFKCSTIVELNNTLVDTLILTRN